MQIIYEYLFNNIIFPSLDFEVSLGSVAESIDEFQGKTGVSKEGHIGVYRSPADQVSF